MFTSDGNFKAMSTLMSQDKWMLKTVEEDRFAFVPRRNESDT